MEEPVKTGPRRLYSQRSNPLLAALTSRAASRPLSDIKEITETSLINPGNRHLPRCSSLSARPSETEHSLQDVQPWCAPEEIGKQSCSRGRRNSRDSQCRRLERNSIYNIPLANVPPRSSSKLRHHRSTSIPRQPAVPLPLIRPPFHWIANHGHSQSPVRDVISRIQPNIPQRELRIPSKTIVKIDHPSSEDLLTQPTLKHPRLKVDLLLAAPLFVGGSSVEGTVRIVVDEAARIRHRKTLTLERVSIDLLGIEEIFGDGIKRFIFLALGNELVDLTHPPPSDMVDSQQPTPSQQRSWILIPSISNLPFLIKLPLNVGPPPFQSKHAQIRYILCASFTIKDAGRQLCVRCSQNTALMSVSDPEKALVSLPSPLTVSETFCLSSSSEEHIVVTAGLHRQVWVSGTNLFVDVHIVNRTSKTVRKLELRLERIILCYRHAAAATLETSASNSRMFDFKEQTTAARTAVKAGRQGWSGVLPNTTVLRTCELELPRGHATINFSRCDIICILPPTQHERESSNVTKRFNYFMLTRRFRRVATVQLPIHIIHMVAAAIEEKRNGRLKTRKSFDNLNADPPQVSLQGRAFAVPRQQSLERARAQKTELQNLSRELENSHRKRWKDDDPQSQIVSSSISFTTPPSNRKGRIIDHEAAMELRNRFNRLRQASFESNLTNRSVPGSKHPPRNSSALGLYLQEDHSQRRNNENNPTVSSRRVSHESERPKRGHERWKPAWIEPAGQSGLPMAV